MNLKMVGLFFAVASAVCGRGYAFSVERGELGGAPFEIVRPEQWSGGVWISVHGLRPESAPLDATVRRESDFIQGLLDEGWLVAATAFRRNGMIVVDASDDVAALIQEIRTRHEPSGLVILEGQSMGGAIVTRLAEERPEIFDGAVVIGGALNARDPDQPFTWKHEPRQPLLFMTNQSELRAPQE
jgi:pimeloyl-ACP methyl ester carboxylesterase